MGSFIAMGRVHTPMNIEVWSMESLIRSYKGIICRCGLTVA